MLFLWPSNRTKTLGVYAWLAITLSVVYGQDRCACSPSTITLQFNLTGVCEDLNVGGPGLTQAPSCSISPFSSGTVSSLVPVRLTTLSIIELGQNLQFLSQISQEVNFVDGDSFRFQSFAATPVANPDDIPRTLEVSIVANNAFNEQLFMVWIINYSADCNVVPVFDNPGQRIGWTTLTTLEDPLFENCPAVGTRPPSLPTPPSPPPPPPFVSSGSSKGPTQAPKSSKAPVAAPRPPTMAPIRCVESEGKGGKKGKRSSSSSDYYAGGKGQHLRFQDPECVEGSSSSKGGKRGKGGKGGKKGSSSSKGKGKGSSSSRVVPVPVPPPPSPSSSPTRRPTGSGIIPSANNPPVVATPTQLSGSGDSLVQDDDIIQPSEPIITGDQPRVANAPPDDSLPPYIPQSARENTDVESQTGNSRLRAVTGVSVGIALCVLVLGGVVVRQRQQNQHLAAQYKARQPEPETVADTRDHTLDDNSESYYQGSLSPND